MVLILIFRAWEQLDRLDRSQDLVWGFKGCGDWQTQVEGDGGDVSGWFGGGADLTPAYLFDDDAKDFHRHYKALCDAHEAPLGHGSGGSTLYRELKARCDDYFMLPARGERRGVGGLFYDDLTGAPGESKGEH